MTICASCLKLIPGRYDVTEIVLCKTCAERFNPNRTKINVPKFDEETIKKFSAEIEKKKVL